MGISTLVLFNSVQVIIISTHVLFGSTQELSFFTLKMGNSCVKIWDYRADGGLDGREKDVFWGRVELQNEALLPIYSYLLFVFRNK